MSKPLTPLRTSAQQRNQLRMLKAELRSTLKHQQFWNRLERDLRIQIATIQQQIAK